MNVYLLDPLEVRSDANELHRGSYLALMSSAQKNSGTYSLVEDLESSDVIIACASSSVYGVFMQRLKSSSIYKSYKDKIFVYSTDDNQYPSIRGIYPGIRREFYEMGWAKGAHYFATFIPNHNFNFIPTEERKFLFSFVGSARNHPVRSELLELEHPRFFAYDYSSSTGRHWWTEEEEEQNRLFDVFTKTTSQSKFCLCPRGIAAGSIRLFEAMEAGCVPIIVSDDFVFPDGPDWSKFIVQVPERKVQEIPSILESMEGQSAEMSRLAREAWETYFSPEITFKTVMDSVVDLRLKSKNKSINKWRVATGELSPHNVRIRMREKYYEFRKSFEENQTS